MNLTTTSFVLFLHIALVIVGLCLAAVLHAGLLLMRAAGDALQIKAWPRVVAVLEATLPIDALLILGTGAWLLHLSGGEFGWSAGWVVASLVGLVAVEVAGASVSRRSAALRRVIRDAPSGPISPQVRRRVLDPVLWSVMHGGTAVFLGIVFLMVVKPSGSWSAAVLLAAAALGVLSARPFTIRPAGRPLPPLPRQPVVDLTEPDESWTRQRS